MITKTSLRHPKVRQAVVGATLNVIKGRSVDHVRNRNGHAYIAIRNRDGGIWALDRDGRDVSREVRLIVRQFVIERKGRI